jgi:hypothetical protein
VGAVPAAAQLVSVRTVPISRVHQFDLQPSLGLAMGGLSIAIDDSLLDPFANPAKGARLAGSRFFVSPGFYGLPEGRGSGRSLPLGALVRFDRWFGGAAVALQGASPADQFKLPVPVPCTACAEHGMTLGPDDRSRTNGFTRLMLGREFPELDLALGVSAAFSRFDWIDGLDLLYAGAARIEQRARSADFRLAALKEANRRSYAATFVYNRFSGTHDALFLDTFWDPGAQRLGQRARMEHNLDQARTWGLHLQHTRPVGRHGWRMGAIATTNLLSHPKIPNYVIQSIPRDPGHSQAFALGVGFAKTENGFTRGIDLIYEPIWSRTWADADAPITTAGGVTIPVGGRTVENWFRFHNATVRGGLGREFPFEGGREAVALRFGLGIHRIGYHLLQVSHTDATKRTLDESWVEWTPTWGLSYRFPGGELHYRGSALNPRIALATGDDVTITDPGPAIPAAPAGTVSGMRFRTVTHQLALVLPIR